ncbi:sensor histidine kinase [Streptomyces sp. SL13]|uniref:histidine kinase n=1 Tax=Streptantibioticus silvisoli TaxID=2705255 RepID=A0AA90GX06_9ACTN|nr:sensor histidine kinase [Streptantibioticus silvisoli]MDI5967698.1 sensor histidine kinase [Streptantibioticus silvisoli]MDI5969663.1 sensor histidine kinase [Streptantibioticus silvisoli]
MRQRDAERMAEAVERVTARSAGRLTRAEEHALRHQVRARARAEAHLRHHEMRAHATRSRHEERAARHAARHERGRELRRLRAEALRRGARWGLAGLRTGPAAALLTVAGLPGARAVREPALRWTRRLARDRRALLEQEFGIEAGPQGLRDPWPRWSDPAVRREARWLLCAPWIGLVALLPALMVVYGLAGQVLPMLTHGMSLYRLFLASDTGRLMVGGRLALFGLAVAGSAAAPGVVAATGRWSAELLSPPENVQLQERVQKLTETRADAVDAQAAELRRIERDLHDGVQARLVAMGLNLGAAEALMERDPQAARTLLAQSREASATALQELRGLVRGIHPPVLAERGLADAVRALALDSPLTAEVTDDLSGYRAEAAVESAVYFAVSELLTNAARHAQAERVWVDLHHTGDALRVQVTDDGAGGADPATATGSGLSGIERRLGTFDGVLAVSSPQGGPTIVTLELPCALSSPRTSTSSGKA